jgi:hypothetical protein
MSSLAHQVSVTGLKNRVFTERQLGEALGGGDARRYGLVNRAIKDGSLIRLKRGTYMLARSGRDSLVHPFAVAQALLPGSYISFESALAFHGWIPESVFVQASVTPGRKTLQFDTADFGQFDFHPLALGAYHFLTDIERVSFNSRTAFVAKPLRALMDLVALNKIGWMGLDWLTNGMRIDEEAFLKSKRTDFESLKNVYKHGRAKVFLGELEEAVTEEKSSRYRLKVDD